MEVKDLHQSIREGDIRVVRSLLESGVDVNALYCRETAFSLALEQKHVNTDIVNLLISYKQFNPDAKNHFDRTPLYCAAKLGYAGLVNRLISMGVEVDQTDLQGITPLGTTAWCNSSEVATTLINAGADVNKCDKRGESPLFRACNNNAFAVACVLLDHGCNPDTQSHENISPLMECIPSSFSSQDPCSKIDLLNLLIKHKCDVNAQDKQGNTALHLSVERSQMLSACILMENGCHVNTKNEDGLSALHIALSPGRQSYKFAACLLTFGCDIHQLFPEIHNENGPIGLILKGMTKSSSSPKTSSAERRLLLKLLISEVDHHRVNIEKLQKLVEMHIHGHGSHEDIDIIDMFCRKKSPCSLKILTRRRIRRLLGQSIIKKADTLALGSSLKQYIAYGLNCHGTDPTKILKLQLAVQRGDTAKVNEFIQSGVEVNFPFLGNSPLALAVEHDRTQCVEVLMKSKADPYTKNLEGDTILHISARFGRVNMIEFFINYGCDVNTKNEKGNLPLHEACRNGKFLAARLLLSNGSSVSLPDDQGLFPLHYAAGSGDLETIKALLEHGSQINARDTFGNTALHLAASNGLLYLRRNIPLPSLYSSELLMNLDMMNIMHCGQNFLGKSAVDNRQHKQVFQELVKAGCDKRLENNVGQTARDIAEEFKTQDYFDITDESEP